MPRAQVRSARSSGPVAVSGPPASPYLSMLTESLDAGVLILDASRSIVHCNDALGAMFGLPAAQIISLGYDSFIERIRAMTLALSDGPVRVPHVEQVSAELIRRDSAGPPP